LFSVRPKLFEKLDLWHTLPRTYDSGQPRLLLRERPFDSKDVNARSGVRVARRRQSAFGRSLPFRVHLRRLAEVGRFSNAGIMSAGVRDHHGLGSGLLAEDQRLL
jgi:hypothetical protein